MVWIELVTGVKGINNRVWITKTMKDQFKGSGFWCYVNKQEGSRSSFEWRPVALSACWGGWLCLPAGPRLGANPASHCEMTSAFWASRSWPWLTVTLTRKLMELVEAPWPALAVPPNCVQASPGTSGQTMVGGSPGQPPTHQGKWNASSTGGCFCRMLLSFRCPPPQPRPPPRCPGLREWVGNAGNLRTAPKSASLWFEGSGTKSLCS